MSPCHQVETRAPEPLRPWGPPAQHTRAQEGSNGARGPAHVPGCVALRQERAVRLQGGGGQPVGLSSRTCTARGEEAAGALLLALLKNSGFGKKGVSNFTKSFSGLSCCFFEGLKASPPSCVREGTRGEVMRGRETQRLQLGHPTPSASCIVSHTALELAGANSRHTRVFFYPAPGPHGQRFPSCSATRTHLYLSSNLAPLKISAFQRASVT